MDNIKLLEVNSALPGKVNVDEISKFPHIKYGTNLGDEQVNWKRFGGDISYAQYLAVTLVSLELAQEVAYFLNSLLKGYEFDYRKVMFNSIKGWVEPHKDGANASTRILWGIKNVSGSILYTSDGDDEIKFDPTKLFYKDKKYELTKKSNFLKDGGIYLLNSSMLHEFIPQDLNGETFFYVYSFTEKYEDLLNLL